MATASVLNKTEVKTENKNIVQGTSVQRLIKNISGSNIAALKPFINDGWDNTENCMKIRLPNDIADVIFGLTLDSIDDDEVKILKYATNGNVIGIDTSSWSVNDFVYVKTDASLTNDPTADTENTIPQEIGLVIRSHAILGEIYIASMASQLKFIQTIASLVLGTLTVRQNGGTAGADEVRIYHDGSNGFIESMQGDLSTNDKAINFGTGIPTAKNIILTDLVSGSTHYIEKDDGTSYLVSIAKKTGFNKDFGTNSGEVAEGNHTHGSHTNSISFQSADGYDITITCASGIITLLSKT